MSNSDKTAYRGINLYIDPTTNEEYVEYGKIYDSPGPAKQYATRLRYPNGKNRLLKKIVNRHHFETKQVQGWNGGVRTANVKVADTYYEFVRTWCERATKWEEC